MADAPQWDGKVYKRAKPGEGFRWDTADGGGYVPSHLGVDSIVIGVYRGKDLHYAARVRAGFVPVTSQGLTAEKMKECVWVKPRILAEIDFLEWTGADHLRHTKFVGLRDDKDPQSVVRET